MLKLGDLLKSSRKDKKISINRASNDTKIPPELIIALEDGNYKLFSSEVYLKGFLKNYAKYLGIDSRKVLALYRRERESINEEGIRDSQKPLKQPTALITPGRIVFASIVLIIILVIAFITIQVNKLVKPPELELMEPIVGVAPVDLVYETQDKNITIVGKVEVGSRLLVNGNEVTTNNLQEFRIDNYQLKNGSNEISILAESYYFSQTNEINLTVLSKFDDDAPKEEASEKNTQTKKTDKLESMEISVLTGNESAWLVISVDDKNVLEELSPAGSKYSFEAKKIFSIYSPKANQIELKINDKVYDFNQDTATIFKIIDGNVIQE